MVLAIGFYWTFMFSSLGFIELGTQTLMQTHVENLTPTNTSKNSVHV